MGRVARRDFLIAVGALLTLPFAEAQQAARLPRIGVLLVGTSFDDMREGFRERGYVEGRTAVIEWRTWEGKPDGWPRQSRN